VDALDLAGRLPDSVHYERDGDVAVLRLRRIHKRNALDDELVAGIDTAFEFLPDDVLAVVLAADGDHFSAGLDLTSLTASTTVDGMARSHRWYRAFDRIQYGRVPVVAALHGGVIGGGFELAAAVHIRVADATTFYALPEAQRGIFTGGGGSVRISRLIGVPRMIDLMLTGRVYNADEGQQIGISTYLVDAGDAETRAVAIAHQIATIPPLSVFGILHAVPRNAEADPATGYLLEGLMAAAAANDPAAQERVAAFLAGRAAKVAKTS
jgi:enoyl-CoA hydratase/carnithine racemase